MCHNKYPPKTKGKRVRTDTSEHISTAVKRPANMIELSDESPIEHL
jgi:hypothetical protein